MKTILALLTMVVAGSIAAAQSRPPEAPPPQEGSRVAAPPGWCSGCTDAQKVQRISQESRAKETAENNQWPGRPQVSPTAPPPKYTVFKTNFLVNNDSDKEIREIKWTATLINRETSETIQIFPLQTKKKIAPHKSAKLKERLVVPIKKLRGQVVSATQPAKDPTKGVEVDEKYEIIEILYTDKSVSRP
jgi:hypothetical protein